MRDDHSSMSDEEAVSLALKEKAFFGHIVFRYEEKLLRYIRRLGIHNEEDQKDVLQNIFIKVFRNLHGFDRSLSFSSWIYRIAHNEAVSHYRKTHVRPEGHLVGESDDILALISQPGQSAEEQFDARINARLVADTLRTLPQKYRDPLILRFFEHKEYEEISDILQIPPGTVGTLIHRGKQELKKQLQQQPIDI